MRVLKTLLALLVICLPIGLGIAMLVLLDQAPEGATKLTMVTEAGAPRQLPIYWVATAHAQETRQYQLRIWYETDQPARRYLYFPSFEQHLAIGLNGYQLSDQSVGSALIGPLSRSFNLVALPTNWLLPGENLLSLQVSTGVSPFGALSPIYFGTLAELLPNYRLRLFWSRDLRLLLFGANLILSIACAVIVIVRPREKMFAWLGTVMGFSCLHGLNVFGSVFPQIVSALPWLLMFGSGAALALLGFVIESIGKAAPRFLAVGAVTAAPVSALVAALPEMTPFWVNTWITSPITILALLVAVAILARDLFRRPTLDNALMLLGLAMMSGALLHAVAVRAGLISTDVFLPQVTRFVTLTGIVILLMKRQAEQARKVDNATHILERRLMEKQAELEEVFAQQRQAAELAAKENERRRMTAELHDGVAGHLVNIVALSETLAPDPSAIQQSARYALNELRIVVDAMISPSGDLRDTLARFRERSFDPLSRLGIDTDWSLDALPKELALGPEQTLNVVRILQEALSNAVRHGMPAHIAVTGGTTLEGDAIISVINTGGRSATGNTPGQGLANMRLRAEQIGAKLTFEPCSDGAVLSLRFGSSSLNQPA